VREHWSPLYNGNIAHSVNTLQPFGTWSANGGQAQVLAQVYAYDQLNRLQKSRGIIGLGASNNWEGITDANAWRYVSEYGYDANGNITDCDRYTGDTGLRYDVLRYKYQKQQGSGRLLRNRLYHVHSDHDNLATTDIGDYADDLANFNDPHNTNGTINTANPYGYDALGNLARNTHDGISAIDWTVAGKVKAVHRAWAAAPCLKLQFRVRRQRPAHHEAGGRAGHRTRARTGSITFVMRRATSWRPTGTPTRCEREPEALERAAACTAAAGLAQLAQGSGGVQCAHERAAPAPTQCTAG
jgi:hypothetical protein